MKSIVYILIAYSTIICSCHREVRDSSTTTLINLAKTADSLSQNFQDYEPIDFETYDRIENIRLPNILRDALDSLNSNNQKESEVTYKTQDNYLGVIYVKVKSGNYFSNTKKHIIIHIENSLHNSKFIYIKEIDSCYLLTLDKQVSMYPVNDTIFDVNGDGLKDFVSNWYGKNGCCLKGFSHVYLARKNYNSFSEQFELINPTFSPKEHMVRGICYGHPGDTEMYKYRWNKEKLDTIEYVMFEKDTAANNIGVIISKQRNSEPSNIIRKQKHVPTEYKSINDFGWFMDN